MNDPQTAHAVSQPRICPGTENVPCPTVGNPTSSLNHTRRVSFFSDSSTTLRGEIFESFPSMASRVTPGFLEPSHHIQTLKKLGFTKPPTSPSSSARTRRAWNASSTDRSGQASQRAHKGRPLPCHGERFATRPLPELRLS